MSDIAPSGSSIQSPSTNSIPLLMKDFPVLFKHQAYGYLYFIKHLITLTIMFMGTGFVRGRVMDTSRIKFRVNLLAQS